MKDSSFSKEITAERPGVYHGAHQLRPGRGGRGGRYVGGDI